MELVPVLGSSYGAIAELIFYLFLLVYIIFSIILVYHWKSYATNARVTSLTLIGYFSSTLLFVAIAGFAMLAI